MKNKVTYLFQYYFDKKLLKDYWKMVVGGVIFCFITIIFPSKLYSQSKVIIDSDTVLSIEEIFDLIKKQTENTFIYRSDLFNGMPKVELKKGEISVNQLLAKSLKDMKLDFSISDHNSIILSRSEGELESLSEEVSEKKVIPSQLDISGTVRDVNGEPLVGVNIQVKGTAIGTATNINGKFFLEGVDEDGVLIVSYIGYQTKEITLGGRSKLDITLSEDSQTLDEVVVVGYGLKKKKSLTGSISSIGNEELQTSTHSSLAQNIQGKMAGVQIRQNSGGPGEFNSMINIRGFGTPLFVIDGIVRDGATDFQKINPDDIESISVLKDASAAIYGMNAANGVIIVTTKKGEKGKTEFNYTNAVGFQSPTDVPQMTNAYQWMQMRNDANVNAGGNPYISHEELEKYRNGEDGYGTTDWYDETFKKNAVQQQHNLSARGGNESISYFTSFGYQREEGLLRSGDLNYQKYTFRTNLDVNLVENLKASFNLYGRFDKRETPGESFFFIFKESRIALPTNKPYANGNEDYYGLVSPSNQNPIALSDREETGYFEQKDKFIQSSVALTYDIPFVKGLSLKGVASYDSDNYLGKDLVKSYNLYNYNSAEDIYLPTKLRVPSVIANSNGDDNRVTLQGYLQYQSDFWSDHNLDMVFIFEQREGWNRDSYLRREYDFFTNDQIDLAGLNNQFTSGNESEYASRSFLGRINYDYHGKYLLEVAARYDGSYRYHPSQRWGFFPVVSGGWRISEEDFFRNNISFISNLKIRGSYGQVGEDAGDPFQYVPGFSTSGGGGYEFVNGEYLNGASSPAIVNENLTWFTSTIKNIGLDLELWDGILNFEVDIYERDREGLLAYRNVSLPNTFGGSLPQENLNSDQVKGAEFTIIHNNHIGEFRYSISGNFNYYRTKNVYIERGPFTSSWDQWRNGASDRWKDVLWGYRIDGQFQNHEEIANAPVQNGNIGNTRELPGDFRYEDVNGDGVINGNDEVPLFWGGQPKMHYGMTFSGAWKGFDFNILLQGSGNYSIRFREVYAEIFAFRGNTPAYFYDRWHLADPYDPNSEWVEGTWPASRFISDVGAIYKESPIWRRDASYLRLKNIELGYTFNRVQLDVFGLNNFRIYGNVHNILTFADSFVKPFDPEKIEGSYDAGLTYPLTRSFNFGISVGF